MNKKVLMLLQSEFPPDIRLEKEIKALSDANISVSLLCNQYEKNTKGEFIYCDIFRLGAIFRNKKTVTELS